MNLHPTRYPSIPGIHIITIHHRKSTANSPAFSIYYFQHANTGTVFQRASINIFNWVKMVDYQLELDKVDLIY
ncbi:unnamed protein product [Ambrosiozyma monospora]|uniref:Unnamed protein product n=1 Tax=Ambrosiozyma monospora TaxID=43982 RepID=A0A9W6WJ76_AMBMO|nr:unnamed protein product [Ambrosiozyma monospora]